MKSPRIRTSPGRSCSRETPQSGGTETWASSIIRHGLSGVLPGVARCRIVCTQRSRAKVWS
jgi:hypothetical protein